MKTLRREVLVGAACFAMLMINLSPSLARPPQADRSSEWAAPEGELELAGNSLGQSSPESATPLAQPEDEWSPPDDYGTRGQSSPEAATPLAQPEGEWAAPDNYGTDGQSSPEAATPPVQPEDDTVDPLFGDLGAPDPLEPQ